MITNEPMSRMSDDDKEFFRTLIDTLRVFWSQREALFQICDSQLTGDWKSVYRIAQSEPEIVHKGDELFAELYASIEAGERDVEPLKRLPKDDLGSKPN
jgi:hypothetical protein